MTTTRNRPCPAASAASEKASVVFPPPPTMATMETGDAVVGVVAADTESSDIMAVAGAATSVENKVAASIVLSEQSG